jgi:hypothetical protein
MAARKYKYSVSCTMCTSWNHANFVWSTPHFLMQWIIKQLVQVKMLSGSSYVASACRIISETWWIGKDLEGRGLGLIDVLSWDFPGGTREKYEKSQTGWLVSWPWFKPSTSWIHV